MKNWRLHQSLKSRGWSTGKLAQVIGSARSHVSEVLGNKPGHGYRTRKRLAPLLTPAERALLGWNELGEVVPQETLSQTPNTQGKQ